MVTTEVGTLLHYAEIKYPLQVSLVFSPVGTEKSHLLDEAKLSTGPCIFHVWIQKTARLLWEPTVFAKLLFLSSVPPAPAKNLVPSRSPMLKTRNPTTNPLGLHCNEGTDMAWGMQNKDLPFSRCCEHPWGDGRHRGGWCHPEAVPDVPEAMQRHVHPRHVPLPAPGFPPPLPRLPHAEGRGRYLQQEVLTAPAKLGTGGSFPGLWVPSIPSCTPWRGGES